ncbi:ATP-grasp fold subdomain 1 [Penicillium waksmanii]|uniref:ATP-grasp fold subdomain 1 n=1 Tax=Penicillium waksmanii TaxID=69791 RepID=UPI0025491790|nr:ATP-grasp fold subdomain 1 [Penicillium waksmanii]KAJ5983187.1 ATP-grasp fold subdomain 1 [Penicillium waksmanii]
MSSSPHSRTIKRLLVANRGEIAVRILHATRELPEPVEIFALYTSDDQSHCDIGRPHHTIQIPSASSYLDISLLVDLVQKHSIDAVHPGYGFLSESAEFAHRMFAEAGAIVIGPGPENLARTGDKLQAKLLAQRCQVPVLEAMNQPTANVDEARAFSHRVGFPVMIKAVDGGGGRGIRLVHEDSELDSSIQRAIGESPSRSVFVEKAAVDGFHHVEIQVIGDGMGQVRHLWERDCSVQRRFQKVVECAPALMRDRDLVSKIIDSALKMASEIRYRSLGTFEFLVNEQKGEFYFLEVNPRLQVEHTITESISGLDLVQIQLLLAQGATFEDLGLGAEVNSKTPPRRVTEFVVPSGNGIRVDTNVSTSNGSASVVGSNFDNLLAKIILTASSWEAVVRKAQRALSDSRISGVKTNIDLLRGIVSHPEFVTGHIDTQWLGLKLDEIYHLGQRIANTQHGGEIVKSISQQSSSQAGLPASNLLFRKGDAWSITLEPLQKDTSQEPAKVAHHLRLSRVLRNDFPTSLAAEIEYTTPTSQTAIPYRMQLETTSTAASALVSSTHRRGDPQNPRHIVLPLSGRLIEVLVSDGENVVENQVLAFVKQMKMELEVRSPRAGRVEWVYEMEYEEEDVAEGMLLVELDEPQGKQMRGKL